jgi:dihydroorotate dehydrogenase electron transfer subunit
MDDTTTDPASTMSAQDGTIHVENAEVLSQTAWPGGQFVLRVRAPRCAATALPGSFVHLRCDPRLPMRRPLSIMRSSPEKGWVEFLYKQHGEGLRALSTRQPGEKLSMMGPIGRPFTLHPDRPQRLLIGGGVGIPPMVFLAEHLAATRGTGGDGDGAEDLALVLMGSELPFPFDTRPSRILTPGVPAEAIAAMPLLEARGIASRLASQQGYPGCFDGFVTELADRWLAQRSASQLGITEIFACGPPPMLEATARLAQRYALPAQLSVEEYMACATGGCAGCAIEVRTPDGPRMKRVCVDGPVFTADEIYPVD